VAGATARGKNQPEFPVARKAPLRGHGRGLRQADADGAGGPLGGG
jgi:hypothetical protein